MGMGFFKKWDKPPQYAKKGLSPDELNSLVESVGFEVEDVQLIGSQT